MEMIDVLYSRELTKVGISQNATPDKEWVEVRVVVARTVAGHGAYADVTRLEIRGSHMSTVILASGLSRNELITAAFKMDPKVGLALRDAVKATQSKILAGLKR